MSPSLIENCSIELILGLLQLLNFTAEEEVTHMRGRLTHARGAAICLRKFVSFYWVQYHNLTAGASIKINISLS